MDYPVETLLDTRFIRVYDLQYAPGRHYYSATRRTLGELVADMPEEAFRTMVPDAVSLCVVWHAEGRKDRILLNREYRYPLGRYVVSVPAGLIDPEDRGRDREDAIRSAAVRELFEETGITFREGDRFRIVNPCLFSSPGMTDESNAVARIDLFGHAESELTQGNAADGEKFGGFLLAGAAEAAEMMGREAVSVYTWIGLAEFLRK